MGVTGTSRPSRELECSIQEYILFAKFSPAILASQSRAAALLAFPTPDQVAATVGIAR